MNTMLHLIGPTIWRASWQAALLALVVVLLLRCFGDRLSPLWRFLYRQHDRAGLRLIVRRSRISTRCSVQSQGDCSLTTWAPKSPTLKLVTGSVLSKD